MANTAIKPFRFVNFLFLIFIFLLLNHAYATNHQTTIQTQNKLKQLNKQISNLKLGLAHVADKKSLLNQELANTEKRIDSTIQALQTLERDIESKQQKVNTLERKILELNQLIKQQQDLLAEHIRIRFKMGEYEPIKWLINQNDFLAMNRLLTFHQYLAYFRQDMIAKIVNTKKLIAQNQETLNLAMDEQRTLRKKLSTHQDKLEHSKKYHATIIQSLNHDIRNKQQTLADYENNKEKLSQLLTTLIAQTNQFPQQPFTQMRHKLPFPVHVPKINLQKMNQGITFFADEGLPVYAVHAGKIVFSDWLNGYGMLLIIDHGQGFMSLYAHNQSLNKRKGSFVQQGEQIASVGHTGGIKQNGLYFEIRQHGKAIPPLDWLS